MFLFVFCLCCLFRFHRHLAFLLTYSPICGNSQSKTKRFYDRLSFERARHGHKKKLWHCGAVLSGLGISESVEFHLVIWVSFVVCFCLCSVCVVCFVSIDT